MLFLIQDSFSRRMQDPEVSHYSACNAATPTSSNMETPYSDVETSYSDISTLGRISSSVHTGWLGTSRGGGGLCTENSMRHFAVGSANEQQMLRGGRILSLTDHLIIILSSCCHHHEKWQSWDSYEGYCFFGVMKLSVELLYLSSAAGCGFQCPQQVRQQCSP